MEKLKGEVWYFDFGERYIECYHIIYISDYQRLGKTMTTLILVYSNCHRMLHRKRPWVGKENLSTLLIYNEGKTKSSDEK